jgi:signal transduction histidine kinase
MFSGASALIPDVEDVYGLAFRDLSGDGLPDLYLVGFRSLNRFLVNRGPGAAFEDRTIESKLGGGLMARGTRHLELGCLAADLDNDGDADVVLTGWTSGTRLFLNQGGAEFRDGTDRLRFDRGMDANACAAADADRDGDLDLFFTDEHGSDRFLENRGDAVFRDATRGSGLASDGNGQSAAFCDVDGDGDEDLAVARWFKPLSLFRNDGRGRFLPVRPPRASEGAARGPLRANAVVFGDADNDGDPDLWVTARDGEAVLYRNDTAPGDSAWAFTDVTAGSGLSGVRAGYGSVFADFDQDGSLDLYAAALGRDACFLNDGRGRFRRVYHESPPAAGGSLGYSTGAAAADFDRDGDLDLAVANKDTFSLLFVNPSGGATSTRVSARGALSNRDGVGCRVDLYEAGRCGDPAARIGTRFIASGGGYLSSSDPLAHFGTGLRGTVDAVVTFPSGRAVRRRGLACGRTHAIEETGPVERAAARSGRCALRLARNPDFWLDAGAAAGLAALAVFAARAAVRRSNERTRRRTEAGLRERHLAVLEAANARLGAKNAELEALYAELKAAQAHLVQSEKMASLGQLVAGISHELNNPVSFIYSNVRHLRAMAGGAAAALRRGDAADPAALGRLLGEAEGLLEETASGCRMVKQLTDNLRRFSHADEAARTEADLHEALDAALRMLRHRAGDGVRFEKRYGDLPPVECHPGRIHQVFLNVLSNAIQAVEGRGTVRVTMSAAGGEARIEVCDDGKGIPESVRGRIFDPFFTTQEVGEGTGLGLSIAYSIVRDHGGRIEVESEPGKGSAFTVVLPVRSERDPPGEKGPPS